MLKIDLCVFFQTRCKSMTRIWIVQAFKQKNLQKHNILFYMYILMVVFSMFGLQKKTKMDKRMFLCSCRDLFLSRRELVKSRRELVFWGCAESVGHFFGIYI